LVLQQNVAGGVQLGACFGNVLQVYCESNTGPAISFTSACAAPSFGGNQVTAAFSDQAPSFSGNSGLVNSVWTMTPGPTYQPMFSQLLTDVLRFANQRTDGTEPTGIFSIQHTNNLVLDVISDGYSASKTTRFSDNQGFSHIVQADVLAVAKAATGLGPGVLALGSTTASTATAGSQTLPANPAGFLVFNLGDATIKVPYYNS
jgi:hypothetical protein